jgi:hypothetical protein
VKRKYSDFVLLAELCDERAQLQPETGRRRERRFLRTNENPHTLGL